jgi:seryl-tRNA synthetase
VTLELVGTPPNVEHPLDHVAIGNALQAIDTDRGAKVSGARFYFLTGVGAMLELALVNLAMEQAQAAGFTPVIAPALVKPEVMEGTGFLGAHAAEVYHLEEDDLYLVGTSEVALAGYHSNEILTELPRRYAGFSSCFRREAGSYGKDTKGIIRVHWFDKVEMFSYVPAEDAQQEHQRLLAWEREFMDKLTPVATLNGTLCAVARTIACLLDHHQQPDGSVYVPKALRPWLGGREVLAAQ